MNPKWLEPRSHKNKVRKYWRPGECSPEKDKIE